jgi:hypothetical protein
MIARVEQSRAALEAVLRRSVEAAHVDRLLPVLQDFQSAFNDFCRPMSSQHYTNSDFDLSALGEVLNDDDDLIGTASFLYLAVREDAVQRFWPPEWAPHRRQGPLIERRVELVPGSRADIGQLSMFGDGGIYLLDWEVGRVP